MDPPCLPAQPGDVRGEETVESWMVAHGSGLDELAIFLFPLIFGIGLWVITKRTPDADDTEDKSN